MIEDVESQLGGTQLCVVGFGNEWDLDGALLHRVARDHGGLYTRANDGLALKKFFALCFGNIFLANMLTDPELRVPGNQIDAPEFPIDVCGEDRLTAVVGWNAPGEDLNVTFVAPSGATVTPSSSGVIADRGRTWAFLRVPLPFGGERSGTWKVRVSRSMFGELVDISNEIRFVLSVLAEGGPRFEPLLPERRLYTGDRLNPGAVLRYDDQTAPHADVEVTIEGPGVSLGQLVAERGLATPDPEGDVLDPFRATLQQIAAESGGEMQLQRTSVTVPLYDDGVHDDGGMEADGIYGNPLEDVVRFEGAYDLHAVATYEAGCAAPARGDVVAACRPRDRPRDHRRDRDRSRTRERDHPPHAPRPLRQSRRAWSRWTLRRRRPAGNAVDRTRDGQRRRLLRRAGRMGQRRTGHASAHRLPAGTRSIPIAPPTVQTGPPLGCLTWVLVALVIVLFILLLVVLLT